MNRFRALLWDADAIARNANARDPAFGITSRAASRRLPFRLLRYWFMERLLREEAARRGRRLRVLEIGVDRGQLKAFVDGTDGPPPYRAWDAADCALDAVRLGALGYGQLHPVDLERPDEIDRLVRAGVHGRYDAIILLHVLEHLHEPEGVLGSVSRLLRPDGVVLGGFPVVPDWLAPWRERQLRRSARPFGHVSAFSARRLDRMALANGLDPEFRAGAFALRASGARIEDSSAWLKANLLFGATFPSWPGEIYWRLRRIAPATEPARASPARPVIANPGRIL